MRPGQHSHRTLVGRAASVCVNHDAQGCFDGFAFFFSISSTERCDSANIYNPFPLWVGLSEERLQLIRR